REVLRLGRTVAREVTQRQLRQRIVARSRLGARHALIEERVRLLLAARRTAADDALQLRVREQMTEALTGLDAHLRERTRELAAREMFTTLQRRGQRARALLERLG